MNPVLIAVKFLSPLPYGFFFRYIGFLSVDPYLMMAQSFPVVFVIYFAFFFNIFISCLTYL